MWVSGLLNTERRAASEHRVRGPCTDPDDRRDRCTVAGPRGRRALAVLPDIRWTSWTPAVHSRGLAALLSRSSRGRVSSFCIKSPCPRECIAGVSELGQGTAARRPRPREPAAVHLARELSSGRRGAPRRLFFLYSIARVHKSSPTLVS